MLQQYKSSSQIQMEQGIRRIRGSKCEYMLGQLIGEGQFGKVYKARTLSKLQPVAIKAIRRHKFTKNEKLKQLLQREMQVLSEFKHLHVIELAELIVDKQDVYLVYEYCQGGTLEDKITMTQTQFYPLFMQIIDALCQAEQQGIIHRDIKPANILFKNGGIKVADWGFSRLLESGETTCSFIGSPAYMAPEVLKGQEYSLKADVWSLGVVVYETLVGFCPWSSKSINSLCSEINKKPLGYPRGTEVSKKMQKIISKMLHIIPESRPTFKEIKRMMSISPAASPKAGKAEAILISKFQRQNSQQRKIASCVFFLELIQWSRKNLQSNSSLLVFVKLIEQNLLQLKTQLRQESQIREVWEKELKVIAEMKKKLNQRIAHKNKYEGFYLCKTEVFGQERESVLNPEGQWQSLVKQGIQVAIQQLELAYKQSRESQRPKEEVLTGINLLLDLVLFREEPAKYLQTAFVAYNKQLLGSPTKTLLKSINAKLLRINSLYYN